MYCNNFLIKICKKLESVKLKYIRECNKMEDFDKTSSEGCLSTGILSNLVLHFCYSVGAVGVLLLLIFLMVGLCKLEMFVKKRRRMNGDTEYVGLNFNN